MPAMYSIINNYNNNNTKTYSEINFMDSSSTSTIFDKIMQTVKTNFITDFAT